MKSESDTEEAVLIPNNLTREDMRGFIMSHAEETKMNKAQEMFELSNIVARREREEAIKEADKMYNESLAYIEQDAREGEMKSHFQLSKRCNLALQDALKDRFNEEGFRCSVSGDGMRMVVSWDDFL